MAQPTPPKPDSPPQLENYDQYLRDVLSEYCLQLNPSGTSIIELVSPLQIEGEVLGEAVGIKDVDPKWESPAYLPAYPSISATLGKSSLEHQDEYRLQINESIQEGERSDQKEASVKAPGRKKKVKVYEMEPLMDPEQEKKRQQAVSAKMNRDKHKRRVMELESEVEKLSRINTQCSQILQRTHEDVWMLKKEISEKDKWKAQMMSQIRKKDRELKDVRQSMVLFCNQLDIIAESLGDDNPTKHRLKSLIEQVSSYLPHSADPTSTSISQEPHSYETSRFSTSMSWSFSDFKRKSHRYPTKK